MIYDAFLFLENFNVVLGTTTSHTQIFWSDLSPRCPLTQLIKDKVEDTFNASVFDSHL